MEKYLAPDEKVSYSTFMHWKVYFIPFVFFGGWLALNYFEAERLGRVDQVIEIALISFAVLLFIRAFYTKNTIEFFVTDRRILIKQGLISLSTKGMRLSQIESIDVYQGVLGRVFNYGNVTIHGTGTSQMLLNEIQKPFKFRKLLITAMKDFKS